ncbi:MAG: hypothetical protein GAK45_00795 [Pseudomonas citronellolis]|nr:MAG: hypothetical protein GAK45_00795 [Pseudomonas citronellolis]
MSRRRQRGSAVIETALTLGVILSSGLFAADLYHLLRARADLERSASDLAGTLANQKALTFDGVQKLVAGMQAERGDRYEFQVGKVLRSGKVQWQLPLGSASGLCDNPLQGTEYTGELPEQDQPDADSDSVALLVVHACQASGELEMDSLLLANSTLQVTSVQRLRSADIELDEALSALAGIDYQGSDD